MYIGTIKKNKEGRNIWLKKVSFEKAVFWKEKMMSLRKEEIDLIHNNFVFELAFIDKEKKTYYTAFMDEIDSELIYSELSAQGKQYYFPIKLLTKHEFR